MGTQQNERGAGWSIESRADEAGRTLYSIYIGDRLIVRDALDSDAAVSAARRWIQARRERPRIGREGTSGRDAAGVER